MLGVARNRQLRFLSKSRRRLVGRLAAVAHAATVYFAPAAVLIFAAARRPVIWIQFLRASPRNFFRRFRRHPRCRAI